MQIINFQDTKWEVIYMTSYKGNIDDAVIEMIKKRHSAGRVLKKNNMLYFVREIEDAVFTEENDDK